MGRLRPVSQQLESFPELLLQWLDYHALSARRPRMKPRAPVHDPTRYYRDYSPPEGVDSAQPPLAALKRAEWSYHRSLGH